MLTFDTLKINTAGSVMNIFESAVFGKLVFRQLHSLLGYVTRGGPGLFGLRHSWIHSASHISWTNPDEWHFLIKPVAVFWLPFLTGLILSVSQFWELSANTCHSYWFLQTSSHFWIPHRNSFCPTGFFVRTAGAISCLQRSFAEIQYQKWSLSRLITLTYSS